MKKGKIAVLAGLVLVIGLIMMTGCNNNQATTEDTGVAEQASDQAVAPAEESAPAATPAEGMPAGAPADDRPVFPGRCPGRGSPFSSCQLSNNTNRIFRTYCEMECMISC